MTQTRIVELRQAEGWTQEKLAEASGVGLRTIQRLEAGHDASLETISLVAAALRLPVRDLFSDLHESVLSTRVETAEARTDEQQGARDRRYRAWRRLYVGTGIVVTLVAFALGSVGLIVILAYWIGVTIIAMSLRELLLEPALDRAFPLTRSRAAQRAARRAPVVVPGEAISAPTP